MTETQRREVRGGQTVTREGAQGETQTETDKKRRRGRHKGKAEGRRCEAEERATGRCKRGGCTVQASGGGGRGGGERKGRKRRPREERGELCKDKNRNGSGYCRGGRHWPGPAPGAPSAATRGRLGLLRGGREWPGHRAWRRAGCGSCGGGLGDGWETEDLPCSPGQARPRGRGGGGGGSLLPQDTASQH